ncbi:hypothetical protein [Sandaracinobacter sp.]|uniref:hypothetical protein n=1 Tax=Sandaracinobacter sp. TaxID=2487581 RepID=UPI0035B143ED
MPGLISILLLLAVTLLSYHRLEASRAAYRVNNCVLGADNATIGAALDAGTYRGLRLRKHPMAVALVGAVSKPISMAGAPHRQATSAGLALLQGLGAAAMFLFLARNRVGPGTALAATLFFLSLFGPATLFGVTDSYGVTFAVSAIAVLAMGELARRANATQGRVGAGLAVAAAGLANPPAMAILPLYAALRRQWRGAGTRHALATDLAVPAAVAALVAIALPLLISDGWGLGYAQRYATLNGVRDAGLFADYAVGFWLFALVAPLELMQCRYGAGLLPLAEPLRLAGMGLSALLLLIGTGRALAERRSRDVSLACLCGIAALFLFYLGFNPGEVLLYSPQWLFLLVIAASAGLAGGWLLPLAAAILLNLALNLPPLHRAGSADPARCCPDPPPSMLPQEHPLRQGDRLCGGRAGQ